MRSVGYAVYRFSPNYGVVSKVMTRGRAEGRLKAFPTGTSKLVEVFVRDAE